MRDRSGPTSWPTELDFATVHPYPIYQPELYPDSLLGPRMTHAAAFETALAAGAGRPVMVHEYGASSAQFDPELVAALRPAAGLVGARPGRDRLPGLVLDRRRARGVRSRAVRPPAARDAVRGDRPPRASSGRVAGSWPSWPRRSGRSGTSSTGWPATVRRRWRRSRCRTSTRVRTIPPPTGSTTRRPAAYEPAERVWSPERDPTPLVRGLAQRVRAGGAGGRVGRVPARASRRRLAGDAAADRARAADLDLVARSSTCGRASGAARRTTSPAAAALWLSVSADVGDPRDGRARRLPPRRSGAGRPCRRCSASSGRGARSRPATSSGCRQATGRSPRAGARSPLRRRRGRRGRCRGATRAWSSPDRGPAASRHLRAAGRAAARRPPDAHGPRRSAWGLYAGLAERAGIPRPSASITRT